MSIYRKSNSISMQLTLYNFYFYNQLRQLQLKLKSVQADENLTKTCLTRLKNLQIMLIWYHLAALTEVLLTRYLFSLL